MCASPEGLDFDAIARKLASDLAAQGVTPPELPGKSQAPETVVAADGVGTIELTMGEGDMPKVILRHAVSNQSCEIYTYGAAVTSWRARNQECLWLSGENKWEDGGKAIRGGIPICFPQFGDGGDLVQHGFARISKWEIEDTFEAEDGSVSAVFSLSSDTDQAEVKKWGHKFEATYTVTLSLAGLETNLQVTNTGETEFDFTMAFHNYIKSSEIADTRVFGYEGVKYFDRLQGDKECGPEEDTGAGLMLTGETDRIYLDTPDELAAFDFGTLSVFKLKKTPSLPDCTLWNPFGEGGCDPGWRNFVCIEPAAIAKPAKVQPGERWVGSQLLGLE